MFVLEYSIFYLIFNSHYWCSICFRKSWYLPTSVHIILNECCTVTRNRRKPSLDVETLVYSSLIHNIERIPHCNLKHVEALTWWTWWGKVCLFFTHCHVLLSWWKAMLIVNLLVVVTATFILCRVVHKAQDVCVSASFNCLLFKVKND